MSWLSELARSQPVRGWASGSRSPRSRCWRRASWAGPCSSRLPHLSGLLAGSMTDPPALAFAGSHGHADAPTLACAAVYPLTMLLRILVAQTLVLVLFT